MKKVLILGINNLSNMGDNLIAESTEFLVRKVCPECEVTHKDLFLRWKQQRGLSKYVVLLLTSLRVLFEKIKLYRIAEFAYFLQHVNYYKRLLREADYTIATSGMLKYNSQGHAYMYSTICRIAEKMGKPLLLNAKSVQKRDDKDIRYKMLFKALHRKGVNVNTRDGEDGVEILKNDYCILNPQYVGDPALWADEMYFNKTITTKHTNEIITVGINLIRPSIYHDYGQGISTTEVVNLYDKIIFELNKRGYRWQLFCNGMREDYELMYQLNEENCQCDAEIPSPNTVLELVRTINSFDIIIGFRLHACITAVAYNLPVVGMIWDDKSRCFAKSMGIDQFFVEPSRLEAKHIVDLLERRMKIPLNYSNKTVLKEKCMKEISDFLNIGEIKKQSQ